MNSWWQWYGAFLGSGAYLVITEDMSVRGAFAAIGAGTVSSFIVMGLEWLTRRLRVSEP